MKFSKLFLCISGLSIIKTQGMDFSQVIDSVRNKEASQNSNQNTESTTIDNSNNSIDTSTADSNTTSNVIDTSEDCINFNKFMSQFNFNNSVFSCCDNQSIFCKGDNIIAINIDFSSYSYTTPDFTDFPILSKLRTIDIKNIYKTYDSSNSLPEVFFQLPSLETLNVLESNLEVLPTSINSNSPLKSINLSDNFINSFPYQFKALPNLKKLNLNKNNIAGALTSEIKEFALLEELNISYNIMSGEIYIPKNLLILHAVRNNFNKIELESSSNNLTNLYLGSNYINDEDFKTILSLKKLKNLYLTGNKQIEVVPAKIKLLKELQYLDLGSTNIKKIPSTIFELSNLTSLSLSNNKKLSAKIINFGNQINSCDLSDINIECYQENTCKYLTSSNYTVCSEEAIQEVKADQKIQDEIIENEIKSLNKPKMSSKMKYLIIGLISLALIIIISIIIFFRLRKHFSKLYNNKEADIVIAPTIIKNSPTDSSSFITCQNFNNNSNLNSSNSVAYSLASSNTLINPDSLSSYPLPSQKQGENFNSSKLKAFNGQNVSGPSSSVLPIYSINMPSSSSIPINSSASQAIDNSAGTSSNTVNANGHSTQPLTSDKLKKYFEEYPEENNNNNNNNTDNNPPPYSEI